MGFLALLPLRGLEAQEGLETIQAAGPGQRVVAPDLKSQAELVTLSSDLAPSLLGLPVEGSLRLANWPVAPEVRRDVIVTRHEIYSPDAHIYKAEGTKLTEIPRSGLAFFWGVTDDSDPVQVVLAIDPVQAKVDSYAQTSTGMFELHPAAKAGQHLVAAPGAFLSGDTPPPHWSCGEEEALQDPTHTTSKVLRSILGKTAAPFTDLHSATVAFDTDNEFMLNKFNNNLTNAGNYVATLLATIDVMYERDLHVRLLQGTTFLRVSTTADPYVQGSANGAASGAQLSEVSSYWSANYGTVKRAVTAMLSGKGSSNVGSGIAWVSGLCSPSYGYSFSQVFLIDYMAGDALIVGHEIGHNFGSPHTHCYSPPVDNCFNAEAGCYSGPESCPAPINVNGVNNVVGTIMSYCQLIGCVPPLVFHPRSLTEYINSAMTAANNVCLLPISTTPTISTISPASGPTAGGTVVQIRGTNFQHGATVTLGGTAATSVNVVDLQTITAVSSAHSAGVVSVAVTNPDNGNGSMSNSFFYNPPSGALAFYTLSPCRLADTRNPTGPYGGPALAAGAERSFVATGHCGIPSTAKAVSLNISVTGPTAGGFLSFFPGNAIPMGTTSLNFSPGQTRTNNAIFELASDGSGTLMVQNGATGAVQVILDVNGYFQ
ncbi:MAG TPA: M12 family metallo-peptidase [Thermoanaerobaculia bacterium]|nr:M12 family metallo-peptidase [Thermoanaerobaculia bacterium]